MEDGNWVLPFVFAGDGSTRRISRNRFRQPRFPARVGIVPMEPTSRVLERKMLRRITQRVERLSTSTEMNFSAQGAV